MGLLEGIVAALHLVVTVVLAVFVAPVRRMDSRVQTIDRRLSRLEGYLAGRPVSRTAGVLFEGPTVHDGPE